MASSSHETLLEVKTLACSLDKNKKIFHDVTFDVREGDVIIIQGKSGCGKSTLLKCLAHLKVYDGEILYQGKPPKHYGIPTFRTHVLYVPQRPSLLPGTPRDFLQKVSTFSASKSRMRRRHSAFSSADAAVTHFIGRAIQIGEEWGVEENLWDRPWATLSGGEAQRIALASAVGLNSADILLLDEPTSALDKDTSELVEKHLTNMLKASDSETKALIWVTHSAEQSHRVGTRFITLVGGAAQEESARDNV